MADYLIKRADAASPVPSGAACQNASFLSTCHRIPCGEPAVAIVEYQGEGAFYMCAACADHNIHDRRGKLVRVKKDWAGIAYGVDKSTYKVDD